jgi:hypothetical protein
LFQNPEACHGKWFSKIKYDDKELNMLLIRLGEAEEPWGQCGREMSQPSALQERWGQSKLLEKINLIPPPLSVRHHSLGFLEEDPSQPHSGLCHPGPGQAYLNLWLSWGQLCGMSDRGRNERNL